MWFVFSRVDVVLFYCNNIWCFTKLFNLQLLEYIDVHFDVLFVFRDIHFLIRNCLNNCVNNSDVASADKGATSSQVSQHSRQQRQFAEFKCLIYPKLIH